MLKLIATVAVASLIAGNAFAQTPPGPTNPTVPPTTEVTPPPGIGSGSAPLGPPAETGARVNC